MLRNAGWLVVVLSLLGCASKPRAADTVHRLLDVDCSGMKLRFEERAHVVDSFAGVSSYLQVLLVDTGGGFRELDRGGDMGDDGGHREGPEAFSRLLPPELRFRAFPFGETRPRGDGSAWGVFVPKGAVSAVQYETIASCLARELATIDAALAAPREPGQTVDDRDRRRQLTSIVYAAYDRGFATCGQQTIGARWDCPGGTGYLKTRPAPPSLLLCTTKPPRDLRPFWTVFHNGMPAGQPARDQRSIEITPPMPASHESTELLRGADPVAYYRTCRDAAGRTVFDVFR